MKRSAFCAVVVCAVVGMTSTVTNAEIFVPSGLNFGDTYHLAFVTSGTRDATSSDIADYNTFVREQAELTGAFTKGFGIDWFAIASTATVDARDNAPVSAPVYLLDGTLISTAGPTIYGGSLASPLNTDQSLNTIEADRRAWTGSTNAGEGYFVRALGESSLAITGDLFFADGQWITHSLAFASDLLPLYALSSELTVVPEPASFAMLAGLAVMGLMYWRRRKAA